MGWREREKPQVIGVAIPSSVDCSQMSSRPFHEPSAYLDEY